jgi:hypothetical protein
MPSPKYNATHESWGWKFECSSCEHQWWLKLINTEIASARKRTGTHPHYYDDHFYDNRYEHSVEGEPENQNTQTESSREEVKNLPMIAPKRQKERSHRLVPPPLPKQSIDGGFYSQKSESSSLFWGFVFFLIIILAGVVYTYRDVFQQKWNDLMLHSSAQVSAMSLPLDIQNVHWDKVALPEGTIKVAVVGEVLNQNKMISRLRPLHMSAWGPCDQNDKASPRCMMGGFLHEFQKTTIAQDERLPFQSSWVLPKGSVVTGVDVTLQ